MATSPVGERIRRARSLASLSARDLSLLAGASHSLVANVERGEIHTPRAETLERIAAVLGVSLEWLIRGNGDEPLEADVRAAVDLARAAESPANDDEPKRAVGA